MISPTLDPTKLSTKEKIKLVRESDGLLIELLDGLKVERSLYLHGCTSLTHLPDGLEVERNLYLGGSGLQHLRGKKIKGVKGKVIW